MTGVGTTGFRVWHNDVALCQVRTAASPYPSEPY